MYFSPAPDSALLQAKLLFDHSENELHTCSNRRLFAVALVLTGRQVLTRFALVIDAPADAQMSSATQVFVAGVTGIGQDDPIFLAQQLGQFSDVGNVRRCGGHRMHSAGIHIGADMDFHTKIPTACLFGFDACPDHALYLCFWWSWVHE